MNKTTKALSATLVLFLSCSSVFAKECCKQEKIQVYARPSLMNADATEIKDANHVYRIGGKVLKQKNRIGLKNEDNVYYDLRRLLINIAWSYDSYKDLEDVADALYDFLMEQKRLKDDYIEVN